MSGSPVKRGSFGDWAIIDNPPISSGCGGCKHYQEDGSCSALPVMANSLGRYAYKHCKEYSPVRASSQSLSVQKNCPYCVYVQATNAYICNQSDSKRYSHECTLCEWYADEYRGAVKNISESVLNGQVDSKDSAPTPTKRNESLVNKQEQNTQGMRSDSLRKKTGQSQPSQHMDSSTEAKKIEALREEYEHKLQILTSEYEERLDSLVLEYGDELTQKEFMLQSANVQLEEQKAKLDRLIAENTSLQTEVMQLRDEADSRAQIEKAEQQADLDLLRTENEQLQVEVSRLRQESADSAKVELDTRVEFVAQQLEVERLSAENTKLQDEILKLLEEMNTTSQAEHTEQRAKLELLRTENTRLQSEVIRLRNEADSKSQAEIEVHLRLVEKQLELDGLSAENARLHEELLRLSTENSELKSEATCLRDAVDVKSQTELDAQVELLEKQTELDQLNAEPKHSDTEVNDTPEAVDPLPKPQLTVIEAQPIVYNVEPTENKNEDKVPSAQTTKENGHVREILTSKEAEYILTKNASKSFKTRKIFIVLMIPFLFLTALAISMMLSDIHMLSVVSFFGIPTAMFAVLSRSPKHCKYILGRDNGLKKGQFVLLCITAMIIAPILCTILIQ